MKKLFPYLLLPLTIFLVAVFAFQLAPYDPYLQDLSLALRPPDAAHLLGTDRYGRDVLSRVIVGSQTTLLASLALLAVIVGTGSALGVAAGWLGGKVDIVLMRLADFFLAFPQMVFAVAVAGVLGGGILNAAMAIAVVAWPKYARLTRGLVLTVKHQPYIEAAELSGAGEGWIICRHILPNIAPMIVVTGMLDLGMVIMELAGLSFLGLGAMPPLAEWGAMMNNGRSMLQSAPWVILSPGAAIFLTVAGCNLLGDRLRDVLTPK